MMGLIWCLNKIIPNSMTMSLVDVEALILKELKGLSGGEIALVFQLLGKVGVSV
jgi:hypothetical protein